MQQPADPRLQTVIRLLALTDAEVRACFADPTDDAKADAAAETVEMLARKLRVERLPVVARTPARVYGGLTLLGMLENDRHVEVLAATREGFERREMTA
jgi:hypothetical protein